MKRLWKILAMAMVFVFALAELAVPAGAEGVTEATAAKEVVGGRFNGMPWMYDPSVGKLALNGLGELPSDSPRPWQEFEEHVDTAIFRSGITVIPDFFMNFCINMTTIMIPASVIQIGEGVLTVSQKLTDIVYEGDLEQLLGVQMSDADREVVKKANFHSATIVQDGDSYAYRYTKDGVVTTTTVSLDLAGNKFKATVTYRGDQEIGITASMKNPYNGEDIVMESELLRSWVENGVTHNLYKHSDSVWGEGTSERILYSDDRETAIYRYENLVITYEMEGKGGTSLLEYQEDLESTGGVRTRFLVVEDFQNFIYKTADTEYWDGRTEHVDYSNNGRDYTRTVRDNQGVITNIIETKDYKTVSQTDFNEDGSTTYTEFQEDGTSVSTYKDIDGNVIGVQNYVGSDLVRQVLYFPDGDVLTTDYLKGGIITTQQYTEATAPSYFFGKDNYLNDLPEKQVSSESVETNDAGDVLSEKRVFTDGSILTYEYVPGSFYTLQREVKEYTDEQGDRVVTIDEYDYSGVSDTGDTALVKMNRRTEYSDGTHETVAMEYDYYTRDVYCHSIQHRDGTIENVVEESGAYEAAQASDPEDDPPISEATAEIHLGSASEEGPAEEPPVEEAPGQSETSEARPDEDEAREDDGDTALPMEAEAHEAEPAEKEVSEINSDRDEPAETGAPSHSSDEYKSDRGASDGHDLDDTASEEDGPVSDS